MIYGASDAIAIPEPDVIPSDLDLGKQVLHALRWHYPGWEWSVDIPPNQNMVVVRNYDCDPRGNMGFAIYKDQLWAGDMRLKVMRAGGEFLERYKQRASRRPEGLDWRDMLFQKPEA